MIGSNRAAKMAGLAKPGRPFYEGVFSRMAILDYQKEIWFEALKLDEASVPDALVLEGTWWREQATKNRLSFLKDVRELAFPEMFMGRWRDISVVYCCAYGAARAVEPAHIFAQMGTPLLIQIGTCGTLDMASNTGDVVLPVSCAARDGVSQYYGAGESLEMSSHWVGRAEEKLGALGVSTRRSNHLTWPSLFAQSDQMCADWAREGLQSVDMETSIVASVASYFGVSAVSMLSVWDALPLKRTFLDPLDPPDAAALKRSNEAVFEAALALAEEVAST